MQKRIDSTPIEELEAKLPEPCHNFLRSGFANKSSLTKLNYARDIQYFFEYAVYHFAYFSSDDIKDITIEDIKKITPLDINRYLSHLSDLKRSDKTISRRKSSISALFKYLAFTEQVIPSNPVQGASTISVEKSSRVIYLNRKEQKILLNTIIYGTGLSEDKLKRHKEHCKRDLAIVYLFLDTGLRISELQGLDIRDIDLKKCELYTIRKGKKKTKDIIYFSDEAAGYIEDYLNERRALRPFDYSDPLFLSNRNNRISIRTIEVMLDKYVDAAFGKGQKKFSPHKLRSSFAMEFYRAQGGDILMLQSRMGHQSIVSTNVYAKAFENEAIEATRNWRNE